MPQARPSSILAAIKRYGRGLLRFIRNRVKTDADAEDILQEVWYQLSAVTHATDPIEQTGAWLYSVARHKIIDRYKKKHELLLEDLMQVDEDDEGAQEIQTLLLTEADTPETEYLHHLFWQELFTALDELPPEQKTAFVAQELEGKSFKELAAQTGEPIQTWVSRKYYAVLHLRRRLKLLYDELMFD